ncbi:hypothetical protein [Amycolatopsis saalfeldensis]|uniref:Uncharacterized protein n=1 Tax=Amycolatopsis saalfeldensis TaxID=394193 RepID=A0A1H8YPZ4_9PSEU|nr:hypothetical protein [Amycolatopsis saalfeldensis]SEP54256.1 hypothetical protein SAMN04489732_14113 [Amycolatopsis saalfeldensis]
MEWFGFVGAWLLVAGSAFQAALELREQEHLREEVTRMLEDRPAPPSVSHWWWLLPPLGYVLERRRWKARQQQMLDALDPVQRNALVQYMNKTTGWSFVGFGGFLIAVKETWALRETYEWPAWVFAALVVAAGILCLSFAVAWLERKDRTSGRKSS